MNRLILDKIDRMTTDMLNLYEYISKHPIKGAELQIAYRDLDRSHKLLLEAKRIAMEAQSEQGNVINFKERSKSIRSNR